MDNAFDPYDALLGLPPGPRPPDHYQLLGLSRFESEPPIIAEAANRHMAAITAHLVGPLAERAQAILAEIATAKAILLLPAAKADYDQTLRERLKSTGQATQPSGKRTDPQPTPSAPKTAKDGSAPTSMSFVPAGGSQPGVPSAVPTRSMKIVASAASPLVPERGAPDPRADQPTATDSNPIGMQVEFKPRVVASEPTDFDSDLPPTFLPGADVHVAPTSGMPPSHQPLPPSHQPLPYAQQVTPNYPAPSNFAGTPNYAAPVYAAPVHGNGGYPQHPNASYPAGMQPQYPASQTPQATPVYATGAYGQPAMAYPVSSQPNQGNPIPTASAMPMAALPAHAAAPFAQPMMAEIAPALAAQNPSAPMPLGLPPSSNRTSLASTRKRSSLDPTTLAVAGGLVLVLAIVVVYAVSTAKNDPPRTVADDSRPNRIPDASSEKSSSDPMGTNANSNPNKRSRDPNQERTGPKTPPTDPVKTAPKDPTDGEPTNMPDPTSDPDGTMPGPPETTPEPTPNPTDPKPTDPKPPEPSPTDPKPTDPKPPEPAPTEPVPMAPDPAEVEAVSTALASAKKALANRNLDLADEQVTLAELSAVSETYVERVAQAQLLVQSVREFWGAVEESVKALKGSEELELDGDIAIVVEVTPDDIIIREKGRNIHYAMRKSAKSRAFTASLARLLADRWLAKNDPKSKLFVGAFLSVDPKGDREDAKRLLQEAKRGGVEAADVLLKWLETPEEPGT